MGNRKSKPNNETKAPEEQSPSPPQYSRSSTPTGSGRPGNPTPYSYGQRPYRELHGLPDNGMSGTNSGTANVKEGEAAPSRTSDTEKPQNSRSTALQTSRSESPILYSREQQLFQAQDHHPDNGTSVVDSDAAEVEEGENARDSNAAEVGEGKAASSDNSDAQLEQKNRLHLL